MENKNQLPLKVNFSWNLLANLIYAFTQWGMLSGIAKLGNTTMVGQFSLGLAVTAPIILFFNFQLRAIQATDSKEDYSFSQYFGLRVVTNIIAFFIIVAIVIYRKYDYTSSVIILLIGISKVIDGLSDIIYGYLQSKERMDYPSISKIIKGILSVIVTVLTLYLTESIIYAMISMCIVYLFIFIAYDLKILLKYTQFEISFQVDKLYLLLKLSFPLGIVTMLNSLTTNIPRYSIEASLGSASLGIFSAISYVIVAGNTFIVAIGQAIAPRMSKHYTNNLKKFIQYTFFSVFFGLALGIIALLLVKFFGSEVLNLLYGKEYSQYNKLFMLLTVTATINFMSSFLGYAMTAARKFRIQPFIGIVCLIVIYFFSNQLVSSSGLYGAAYALMILGIVQFILQLLVVLFAIKERWNKE